MARFVRRSWVVIAAVAVLGRAAAAQRAGTTQRDAVGEEAAQQLNQGRTNEARMTLLKAMRATPAADLQATYRLELGDTYLFDGLYRDAAQAYNAVLSGSNAVTIDSLIRWAHHGLALIEAFNGRTQRAATHYADALKGRAAPGDTIEMLVLTLQHDSALKALERFATTHRDENAQQFTYSFRGLSWLMSGHCTQALPEIAKAPRQDRPIPVAVRGRCAMKHGQRIPALAMRDSVMKQSVPDPFAWYVLIARDVARKIE